MDPDGERWFYKKDDDGKVTDVQWVNPNDDGTYTSPGEGYQEFIPAERGMNHYFLVFNADRSVATLFTEGQNGSPVAFSRAAGGVSDATMGLVADYLLGKAIGTIAKEAFGAWRAYRAAKALEEVAEEAAEKAARQAPKGRLGNPMKVAPRTNTPATIGGRQYTGHALDQMQGRGLTPSVVENTIARGAKTPGRGGATVYTTEQAKVVVNPNGSVKTVMPR